MNITKLKNDIENKLNKLEKDCNEYLGMNEYD